MHDLLCGKLLGDGCLTKQGTRKPRFQFTHCKNDKGWSEYCYEQLSNSLPLNSPKYRKIVDTRMAAGFTESYIVQSRTSDEFSKLYEIWYPQRKKELPFSYIKDYFNEKTFAWWYQDDGHLKQKNGIVKKVIFSTDSFTSLENQFLIDFLQKKYHLSFSIDAQNRLILYDQFQILHFLKLVSPHIHESMNRKRQSLNGSKKIAERSTIYLPTDFVVKNPTVEINNQYKKLPLLMALTENHTEFFKENISVQNETIITKPYQIKIKEDYKDLLVKLKCKTGLTISQITAHCFRL
ncbi:endonuclease [Planococcus sp. 107-1]|uniref:endonuclease n=1 Tax=Planococcus sp. 107-1 TaxID=2908840 RepID=UPI001F3CDF1D|nr:endonuclease [Planococcus sp. 107-1]UJF27087.1 endonuclease [Planococcus sp. 107-1]